MAVPQNRSRDVRPGPNRVGREGTGEPMSGSERAFLDILGDLGARAGQDLQPDRHGVLTLTMDGVEFSLESPAHAGFVYLQAAVRKAGPDRERAFAAAMRRNLFGLPLSSGWLAHDAETDDLRLCTAVPLAGLDGDRLVAVMEALVASVVTLRREGLAESVPAGGAELADGSFLRV